MPQRHFSEANVDSDSFSMKKFKSMFGGSKDSGETEKDGKSKL